MCLAPAFAARCYRYVLELELADYFLRLRSLTGQLFCRDGHLFSRRGVVLGHRGDVLDPNTDLFRCLRLEPIVAQYGESARAVNIAASTGEDGRFESMASHLRLEVIREGRKKASLTLPVIAIEDPESLMGDDIAARLREGGIDLGEVVRRARRCGYAPTDLFTLDQAEKNQSVRVWIE